MVEEIHDLDPTDPIRLNVGLPDDDPRDGLQNIEATHLLFHGVRGDFHLPVQRLLQESLQETEDRVTFHVERCTIIFAPLVRFPADPRMYMGVFFKKFSHELGRDGRASKRSTIVSSLDGTCLLCSCLVAARMSSFSDRPGTNGRKRGKGTVKTRNGSRNETKIPSSRSITYRRRSREIRILASVDEKRFHCFRVDVSRGNGLGERSRPTGPRTMRCSKTRRGTTIHGTGIGVLTKPKSPEALVFRSSGLRPEKGTEPREQPVSARTLPRARSETVTAISTRDDQPRNYALAPPSNDEFQPTVTHLDPSFFHLLWMDLDRNRRRTHFSTTRKFFPLSSRRETARTENRRLISLSSSFSAYLREYFHRVRKRQSWKKFRSNDSGPTNAERFRSNVRDERISIRPLWIVSFRNSNSNSRVISIWTKYCVPFVRFSKLLFGREFRSSLIDLSRRLVQEFFHQKYGIDFIRIIGQTRYQDPS
ncbi:elongation of very long chain fatty acid james bond protein isoform X1 [Ptiloglossa arizonensis]|uniref:elongation of very long chain fatty acid james bond protein isoform X1 n=1 Tax=Ptiloglossa arizonensis TaxID=3350558 RepID=UPI003F9F291D